jgi:uncharacterized protein YbjT (DUF2867 family)
MIVVFGSTGTVGREVVADLVAAGERVRAFVRDPSRARFADGVEVVVGDLAAPETVLAALADADQVFMLSAGADALAHDTTVAAAVRSRGVRHVVKLSSVAAQPPVDNSYGEAHKLAEEAFRASGASWTFLRAAGFMSNVLQWTWSIHAEGRVYAPFGDIPRALIDPRDVAAVAATALMSAGHEGTVYTLTGPEALTTAEQVDRVSAALRRPLEYVEVAAAVTEQAMVGAGMAPSLVQGMLASLSDPDPARGGTPLRTVEQVTGRPAATFDRWLTEYVDLLGTPASTAGSQ